MVCAKSKDHFLFPSTLFCDPEPHNVQTILGSCISVCLFDERLLHGGINHYMMPWWDGKGMPSPKYGDVAIDLLVERMFAMGSNKMNLIAKVFGGASQHTTKKQVYEIGKQNIATAEELLHKHAIRIVSQNVGGPKGRKILFDTKTGQVFMKFLEGFETQ